MNRIEVLLNKLASSRLIWIVVLLALLAAALAAGAPDGGVCPGMSSC